VFSHGTWLPPLRKQFAKVNKKFFNSGKQVVIRLTTPLRMSYEESYVKAFPFDKMVDDPSKLQACKKSTNEFSAYRCPPPLEPPPPRKEPPREPNPPPPLNPPLL